jgi:DNA segregation ATPase FtsK/SpoIIIE, S-DNA-T family
MIIQLTVWDAHTRESQDVEVSASPDTSVGSLLESLPVRPAGRRCFTGATELDPGARLADSPLLPGAVISVGGPGPDYHPVLRASAGTLEVVAGADAGLAVALNPGRYPVARDSQAAVSLRDTDVSRKHAEVEISGEGQARVADLGSSNGTFVNSARVTGWAPLPPGGVLTLGHDEIVWTPTPAPALHTTRDSDGGLEFDRAFAAAPEIPRAEVTLPRQETATRNPMVRVLSGFAGVGTGIVVALATHEKSMLLISVLGLILPIVVSTIENNQQQERTASFANARHAAHVKITSQLTQEAQVRHLLAPGPAEITQMATGQRPDLWPRSAHSPHGLVLRVGVADQPASVDLRGDPWPGFQPPVLRGVPVTVDLRAIGVFGVVGSAGNARALLRWLLAQLATLRAPDDLRIVVITSDQGSELAWARWLPHVRAGASADVPCWIGNADTSRAARVTELNQLIAARLTGRSDAPGASPGSEVVVVLDGALALRNLPGMREVLRDGPQAGVYVIGADQQGMNEYRGLCQVDAITAQLTRTLADAPVAVRPDNMGVAAAERLARAVAPMRDRMMTAAGQNAVPFPVRLLDLLGVGMPSAQDVLRLWARHDGPDTAVVLGADANGAMVVDLARQGPHAMLGGATGAGKSILLRTLVTSLLLANRPDELNLILVDFKGGSAFLPFERCPHVTALIRSTGETAADVFDEAAAARMLASVRAEVRRRESVLARYDGEIDQHWRARHASPDLPPLPRLVMIFDEFARVLESSPDFLKELVNVAGKGRSLGMHLVLATQSLQGKLSPELKNNISLRISLRQNEPADSAEVLGVPDAAGIPGTLGGRGMVLCTTDESRTPRLFQSGYLGDPPPSGMVAAASVRVLDQADLGAPRPAAAGRHGGTATDQDLAVTAIEEAARLAQLPAPFRPVLPPLPAMLALDDLPAATSWEPPATAVAFGLADQPDAQAQPPVFLDLAGSDRLMVAGGPQSGRTAFARALITSLARRFQPDQVHLYLIERQPAGLADYAELPHCGGVFSPAEPERIRRLISWLDQETRRRGAAGSPLRSGQPYILVIIDGWEHFENRSDPATADTALLATLRGVITAGAPCGVHVVPTGGQDMLNGKLPALYTHRLLLPFPNEQTRRAHLTSRMASPPLMPGRAIDAASGRHIQICRPAGHPAKLASQVGPAGTAGPVGAVGAADPARLPVRFPPLPAHVTASDLALPTPLPSRAWVPLGIGGPTNATIGIDLFDAGPHLLLVSGPPESGRSTAAISLARALRRAGFGVLAISPPRSPLARLLREDPEVQTIAATMVPDDDLREAAAKFGDRPYAVIVDDADQVTVDAGKQGFNAKPTLLEEIAHPAALGRHALILGGDAGPILSGQRRALGRIVSEIMTSGAVLLLTPAGRTVAKEHGLALEPDQYFTGPPGRGYLAIGRSVQLLQLASD